MSSYEIDPKLDKLLTDSKLSTCKGLRESIISQEVDLEELFELPDEDLRYKKKRNIQKLKKQKNDP